MSDVIDRTLTPRRRPVAGGYARGEETRARIVLAAAKVFGNEGYERASTRRISEEAGVKPPALQYYFDSKEGLHRACAEWLLERANPLLAVMDDVAHRLEAGRIDAPVDALCDLLCTLVDIPSKSEPLQARFMARLQAEGAGPALPLVRARLSEPFKMLAARLTAAALDRSPDDLDVRIRTTLLISQGAMLHSHRESTLEFLGWSNFEGERGDRVKAALRTQTRAIVSAPLPRPPDMVEACVEPLSDRSRHGI